MSERTRFVVAPVAPARWFFLIVSCALIVSLVVIVNRYVVVRRLVIAR